VSGVLYLQSPHDAVPGIQPGGTTSQGQVHNTMIQGNGIGGPQVAPGHSGIFVDRGTVQVSKSSLLRNGLTGISILGDTSSATILNSTIRGSGRGAMDGPMENFSLEGDNVIEDNQLQAGDGIAAAGVHFVGGGVEVEELE